MPTYPPRRRRTSNRVSARSGLFGIVQTASSRRSSTMSVPKACRAHWTPWGNSSLTRRSLQFRAELLTEPCRRERVPKMRLAKCFDGRGARSQRCQLCEGSAEMFCRGSCLGHSSKELRFQAVRQRRSHILGGTHVSGQFAMPLLRQPRPTLSLTAQLHLSEHTYSADTQTL